MKKTIYFLLIFYSISSCYKKEQNCQRKNLSSLQVANDLQDPYWIFIDNDYVCAVLPNKTNIVYNIPSGVRQFEAINTNNYSDVKNGTITFLKCDLSTLNIK